MVENQKVLKESSQAAPNLISEGRIMKPIIGKRYEVDEDGGVGVHVVTSVVDGMVYSQNVKTKQKFGTPLKQWKTLSAHIKEDFRTIVERKLKKDSDDPCWDDYVQLGMKEKDGKKVPNCVPKENALDEISSRTARKVADRAAKRMVAGVGRRVKDPKTGSFKYVPPTEDEKRLAYKSTDSLARAHRAISRDIARKNEETSEIFSNNQNHTIESNEIYESENALAAKYMTKSGGNEYYSEHLSERVKIMHDRYLRSHGKKARDPGYSLQWMFTSKDMGNPKDNEIVSVQGRLRDAAKEAANKLGVDRIYVMESVDLNEDIHDDLNDIIIVFQKKLMRMKGKLHPSISVEVAKIDKDLDDLRTGSLFKLRPGR